ncbi:transcriptional regulator, TetR family [Hymenobacter roseosalivarius DSM 11622]|uniref:Transcriptional regulator, TetR family n=1 Tax=Hymenobacter roseosalivarius DSM 11622 TaxID=645990 RepID=A0A1W1UGT4_9BACT|nr:TetR/AcrR family transcriptional regulator [Hymenobacter roseosalivarius]SMB80280.1 transcriptional regulator, TetR family [Hymenobacter roseosalivarius DSM 11622]
MKRDRQATEKRIYDAFVSILQENGPRGVGINAISKKAGVSKELIYRYYDGMKGLLLEYAKNGDFFRSLLLIKDNEEETENSLQKFMMQGLEELRSNTLTQEILRWQLLESNELTKDLFRYTNLKVGQLFSHSRVDVGAIPEFQLMIGGYVYFILLSKYNKHFINIDLRSESTWEAFGGAIRASLDKS